MLESDLVNNLASVICTLWVPICGWWNLLTYFHFIERQINILAINATCCICTAWFYTLLFISSLLQCCWLCNRNDLSPPHHNRFMALFPWPPGWAGARSKHLDFMVQVKINRGRHTDHPAGHHSIQTNQCPLPPSPHCFTGRMPFLLPNQQCQSMEGS